MCMDTVAACLNQVANQRPPRSPRNQIGEICRDWTSSSIGPVLYIPYCCIPWHPLSIISFISGMSDDTVNFDEIAVLF